MAFEEGVNLSHNCDSMLLISPGQTVKAETTSLRFTTRSVRRHLPDRTSDICAEGRSGGESRT